jgi:hypothetical protein
VFLLSRIRFVYSQESLDLIHAGMIAWLKGFGWASAILVLMHTRMAPSESSSCTTLPESQYDALKDLYFNTNGSLWCLNPYTQQEWSFPPNQKTAAPCIEGWVGISCGCEVESYQVIALTMNEFCMRGSIPASIGKQALNLSYKSHSETVKSQET